MHVRDKQRKHRVIQQTLVMEPFVYTYILIEFI